ncbi:unnamed protein product, partial [Brachionus calyciflorus]
MAQILASFPLVGDDNNIITPRDINDLMIAENDYMNYNIEEQIMDEHERNLLRFCSLFTNQLKILASIENSFHSIYDFNGN